MKITPTIIFMFIVLSVQQSVFSQELKLDAKKYTIENCVNHFDIDKAIKTEVGYQYWFVDKDFIDGQTLKISVVGPHQSTHPPHKHIEDEFFFILEGTAEFYLDGKKTTGGAYTSFYCPSFAEHGISNVGDTEMKYLVIKKYAKK